MVNTQYAQDGPEARSLAKYLPYYPFKGIPRFYDIGGFLANPAAFQQIVDIFASRYAEIGIDSIAGISLPAAGTRYSILTLTKMIVSFMYPPLNSNVRLDARGFILGPPIALALKKPFLMMRKEGKMPNTIKSPAYETEYGSRSGLTVQRDRINKGDRVLIIDDLVATGGTLSSAIQLVQASGGTVVECACVVELKMFIDPAEGTGLPSRTKLFKDLNIQDTPVWGLVSEDVLTNEAELRKDYTDDGEEH